jgi:surfactin synthase thioesterase subunit
MTTSEQQMEQDLIEKLVDLKYTYRPDHVAMLSEICKAADSGALYTYHFNMLRSISEKIATFFGKKDFSACLEDLQDEALFSRALRLSNEGYAAEAAQ